MDKSPNFDPDKGPLKKSLFFGHLGLEKATKQSIEPQPEESTRGATKIEEDELQKLFKTYHGGPKKEEMSEDLQKVVESYNGEGFVPHEVEGGEK